MGFNRRKLEADRKAKADGMTSVGGGAGDGSGRTHAELFRSNAIDALLPYCRGATFNSRPG